MEKTIKEIVKTYDLYGQSFTYGRALQVAMRNSWTYPELATAIEETIDAYYSEVLQVMEKANFKTDLEALSYVLDLSMLDEMANSILENDK